MKRMIMIVSLLSALLITPARSEQADVLIGRTDEDYYEIILESVGCVLNTDEIYDKVFI